MHGSYLFHLTVGIDGQQADRQSVIILLIYLQKIPQNLTFSHTRNIGISKSFFYRAHILWNNLPYDVRSIESLSIFKNRLLAHHWSYIDEFIRENADWTDPMK
jgi:hypothetical protein